MNLYLKREECFLIKSKQVAQELSAKGPGKCIAIPADLQKLEEVNRLVAELSKNEKRKITKH